MKQLKISPSILNADFGKLGEECLSLQKSGADWLHCDVMDGVFVPNISFGMPIVAAVRGIADIPLDVHLMICEPSKYVEDFVKAGADILTVHYEATDFAKALEKMGRLGVKRGIAIRPATPVEKLLPYRDLFDMVLVMSVEPGFGGQKFMPQAVDKILKAKELFPEKLVEVDGGINLQTGKLAADAGVDVLVAGSFIVSAPDRAKTVDDLKKL